MMVSKFVRQKLMKIMESFPDITRNNHKQLKKFPILGMCGIAILFLFGFTSVFEKKAGNLFGMSFVLFGLKKNSVRFEYCSYLLLM